MKKEMEKFQRALDSSMIIALGKTVFFAKYWEYVKQRLGTRSKKKLENIKIAIREQINSLPDGFFFIPPELAISEEGVRKYFQNRFEDEEFRRGFTNEVIKRTRLSKLDFAELLAEPG